MVTVTVKCVACDHREEVGEQKDTPMCSKCFSPMIADRVQDRRNNGVTWMWLN